ncbi:hypothetical protein ILUMI_06341, partial [Ignelater luminosus]
AILPRHMTVGAAGMDVASYKNVNIRFGVNRIFLGFNMPYGMRKGYYIRTVPRSSYAAKGIFINGVIDSDFKGELFIQALYLGGNSAEDILLKEGERFAQFIIEKHYGFEPLWFNEGRTIERGDFHGSTSAGASTSSAPAVMLRGSHETQVEMTGIDRWGNSTADVTATGGPDSNLFEVYAE